MTIIDVEALGIRDLHVVARAEVDVCRIVLTLLAHRIRHPATWVDRAEQHVDDSVACFLAWQMREQDGGDVRVIDPWLDDDGADSVQNDDGVGANRGGALNEVITTVPETERCGLEADALALR